MAKPVRAQKIDTIFVLAIFCVFAASVLMSLMFGASIYKNTTDKSNEKYGENICLSYVWMKVKNTDSIDNVYVDTFHDLSVLCLDEEYDGITYQTQIYLYEGWVCELFTELGLDFYPDAGMPVVEADSLSFETLDSGLIKVTVNSESLILYPRSKVEYSPG